MLYPCKNCIVRASCTQKCKEMKRFENIYSGTLILSGVLLYIFLYVIICIIFFLNLPSWAAWICSLIILIVMYGQSYYDIFFNNYNDFKEQKKWEKTIILILAPWGYLSGKIYDKFEDSIELHLYRFNYNITNRYIRNLANDKTKRQVKSNVGISRKIWKSKGNDR
jgi:ABC-type multidrug transport system permease subunit